MLCSIKKLWLGSTEEGTDLSEPDCTQGHTELLAEIGEIVASVEANDRPPTGWRTQHTSEDHVAGDETGGCTRGREANSESKPLT